MDNNLDIINNISIQLYYVYLMKLDEQYVTFTYTSYNHPLHSNCGPHESSLPYYTLFMSHFKTNGKLPWTLLQHFISLI